MNSVEDNRLYFESDEYKNWKELATNKTKQYDIGYWICYYEGGIIVWEFKRN